MFPPGWSAALPVPPFNGGWRYPNVRDAGERLAAGPNFRRRELLKAIWEILTSAVAVTAIASRRDDEVRRRSEQNGGANGRAIVKERI